MEAMACYGWPLNVRELDNVVRMLDVMAQGGPVQLSMLPEQLISVPSRPRAQGSKAQQVLDTLKENGGNIRRTSQQLGVSRSYIYRCLDRSGISPKSHLTDRSRPSLLCGVKQCHSHLRFASIFTRSRAAPSAADSSGSSSSERPCTSKSFNTGSVGIRATTSNPV